METTTNPSTLTATAADTLLLVVMGWTEMATAQRYTHAVDELRRRAARQMGGLLWAEQVGN
jgi:hypothetical protein